jgi:hypothetical protein
VSRNDVARRRTSSSKGSPTTTGFLGGALQVNADVLLGIRICEKISSARSFLRADLFFEAVSAFHSAQRQLSEMEDLPDSVALVAPLRKITGSLGNDIVYAMEQRCTRADLCQDASSMDALLDLHISIESFYGCSPSSALDRLVLMHQGAIKLITQDLPTQPCEPEVLQKVHHVRSILCSAAWYAAHVRSMPHMGTSRSTALSAEELMASQQTGDAFIKVVSLHVCGFRSLTSDTRASQEGWGLSPVANVTKVELSSAAKRSINLEAQAAVTSLVAILGTVGPAKVVTDLEAQLIDEMAQFHVKASNGSDDSIELIDYIGWEQAVRTAVTKSFEGSIAKGISKSLAIVETVCESAKAGKTLLWPTPRDDAVEINSLLPRMFDPQQSTASLQVLGGGDAPAAVSAQMNDIVGMLMCIAPREASASAIANVARGIQSMASAVEGTIAAFSNSNEGTELLLSLSAILDELLTCLRHMGISDNPTLREITAAVDMLQKHYVDCHKPWITAIAESFRRDLSEAYISTGLVNTSGHEAKLVLANSWDSTKIEDASVSYPRAPCHGVNRALVQLQGKIFSLRPSSMRWCLIPVLHSALRSAVVASITTFLEAKLSEEAILQLSFDVLFFWYAFGASPNDVNPLLSQLEERVDVVTWSISFPLISKAARNYFEATEVAFGFFRLNETALGGRSGLTFSVVLEPESDRFPLLPISTPSQTRQLFQSLEADKMSDAIQEDSKVSSWTSKGLRTISSLWGS